MGRPKIPRDKNGDKIGNKGRPTVMTERVLQKLEQAWALGCTDREACFYADISVFTLQAYQDRYPEYIQRKEILKSRPVLAARKTVVKAVETDPDIALKFLERKLKKEFSTRQETTGADGESLNSDITESLNRIAKAFENANQNT